MDHLEKKEPGAFSWVELVTSNRQEAKAFYSAVFGWTSVDLPSPGGPYTMLRQNGADVAGLYEMSSGQRDNNVRPHWLSYLSVEDVDDTTARAFEMGATVVNEPVDIGSLGRVSVIEDPEGAVLALWKGGERTAGTRLNEPVSLCWNERVTRDPQRTEKFYGDLLNWEAKSIDAKTPSYKTFYRGGNAVAGLVRPVEDDIAPHWKVYFSVVNADAAISSIRENGGILVDGPKKVSGLGDLATAADPQGALFSIIRRESESELKLPSSIAGPDG